MLKKNGWFTWLAMSSAVIAALAMISTTAFAQIIDKGDLGQYERHGRFVHRVLSGGDHHEAAGSITPRSKDTRARYETSVQTYVREGRFMKPVRSVARPQDSSPKAQTAVYQKDTRPTYKTSVQTYERQGRFMWPKK